MKRLFRLTTFFALTFLVCSFVSGYALKVPFINKIAKDNLEESIERALARYRF